MEEALMDKNQQLPGDIPDADFRETAALKNDILRHIRFTLGKDTKWEDAEKMIHQLNLDPKKLKSAFQTAIDWAGELATLHSKQSQGD